MFRHVEALVAHGYDAVVRIPISAPVPEWFQHHAPVERMTGRPGVDDILVLPEDDGELLAACSRLPNRKVIFCQNPYAAALRGVLAVREAVRAAYPVMMACSDGVGDWVRRFVGPERVVTVPGFADERLFVPAPKLPLIACMPRKRRIEGAAIRNMFARLYDGPTAWRWDLVDGRTEAEAAVALGRASVFLSLARLEGMSMTIVEAMACGCLVAGFTGIGPREYAGPQNGFWVEEDDCEAAAHALVRATRLAEAGGPAAEAMRAAARDTAARWSHAASVEALLRFWRDEMGVTA
ncbi:MAG: glycosyltransferase [Caulobacterales bacterium]|nr:glycosyltransferase [Caulobacterales bacterium]